MEEKEKDKEEIHRLNGEIGILTKKLDHENLMRMQIQVSCVDFIILLLCLL